MEVHSLIQQLQDRFWDTRPDSTHPHDEEWKHETPDLLRYGPIVPKCVVAGVCRSLFPWDGPNYSAWWQKMKPEALHDLEKAGVLSILEALFSADLWSAEQWDAVAMSNVFSGSLSEDEKHMLALANRSVSKQSRVAAQMEIERVLEELLLPLLASPDFTTNPFAPLVYAIISLLHYKWSNGIDIWEELEGKYPQIFSTLLKQCRYLALGQEMSLSQRVAQMHFLSHCANHCDRDIVWNGLHWFVDESLLKPVLPHMGTMSDTTPQTILFITQLVAEYNITALIEKVASQKTYESLVTDQFRWLVNEWVALEGQETSLEAQWNLADCSVVLLTSLIELTSQTQTGRYLAWFIYAESPPSSLPPLQYASPFPILDVLHQSVPLFPFHRQRLLDSLLWQLEGNIAVFLQPPAEAVPSALLLEVSGMLTARQAHRESIFNILAGLNTSFPDDHYWMDVIQWRNLFMPRLGIRFLDWKDYVHRHLSLFKATVSVQLHDDFHQACIRANEGNPPSSLSAISHFRITRDTPLRSFPQYYVAAVFLNEDSVVVGMATEWTERGSAPKGDVQDVMSALGELNLHKNKESIPSSAAKAEPSPPPRTHTPFLPSCLVVLTGTMHSGGVSQPFYRGARLWKYGHKEHNVELPDGTILESARPLLIMIDQAFFDWYRHFSQQATVVFEQVFFSTPQLSAYTYTIGSVERMLALSAQFEVSDWLQELLLGHAKPSEAISLAATIPEGGLPARLELLGALLTCGDVVEGLSALWKQGQQNEKGKVPSLPGNEHVPSPNGFSVLATEEADTFCWVTLRSSDAAKKEANSQIVYHQVAHRSEKSGTAKESIVEPSETPFRLYDAQIQAVLSAVCQRVTLVVGPPGTGKTDVASLIVRILYRNYWAGKGNTRQRILITAQSNLALDHVIDKTLPVLRRMGGSDAIPLLRLGAQYVSSEAGQCTPAAHRYHLLRRRRVLLEGLLSRFAHDTDESPTALVVHLKKLQECLTAPIQGNEMGNETEAATALEAFHTYLMGEFDQKYRETFGPLRKTMAIKRPVSTQMQEVLTLLGVPSAIVGRGSRSDMCKALQQVKHDVSSFYEAARLSMLPPSEFTKVLMRNVGILCMTCSGAAMKESDLDGIVFDTLVVEEAGKILETELLPLFRHNPKRVIMLGDDSQLAPLIRDEALRNQHNYSQTLFARWRRMGVPTITLNCQGRAVPEICDLYRWSYEPSIASPGATLPVLRDLAATKNFPEWVVDACTAAQQPVPTSSFSPFLRCHAQFVDVRGGDDAGASETRLEECEWIALFYEYLVLVCGVPPAKVTVLSPYRKQVQCLRTWFGTLAQKESTLPAPTVCTTDEFQGLENDIILVSMVLSRKAPSLHLRDRRRLTVLLSRAKLGLFLFGSRPTFEAASEWNPVFLALNGSLPYQTHSGGLPPSASPQLELACGSGPVSFQTRAFAGIPFATIHSTTDFGTLITSHRALDVPETVIRMENGSKGGPTGLSVAASAWLNDMEEERSMMEEEEAPSVPVEAPATPVLPAFIAKMFTPTVMRENGTTKPTPTRGMYADVEQANVKKEPRRPVERQRPVHERLGVAAPSPQETVDPILAMASQIKGFRGVVDTTPTPPAVPSNARAMKEWVEESDATEPIRLHIPRRAQEEQVVPIPEEKKPIIEAEVQDQGEQEPSSEPSVDEADPSPLPSPIPAGPTSWADMMENEPLPSLPVEPMPPYVPRTEHRDDLARQARRPVPRRELVRRDNPQRREPDFRRPEPAYFGHDRREAPPPIARRGRAPDPWQARAARRPDSRGTMPVTRSMAGRNRRQEESQEGWEDLPMPTKLSSGVQAWLEEGEDEDFQQEMKMNKAWNKVNRPR